MSISVTEILHTVENLEINSFEHLYQKFSELRVKRSSANDSESDLLQQINKPFDDLKWERLKYLDWKLEFDSLNQKEEKESLRLAESYEEYCVLRLKNITKLAKIKQIPLDLLIEKLGLNQA
jgi:hypothetical protein